MMLLATFLSSRGIIYLNVFHSLGIFKFIEKSAPLSCVPQTWLDSFVCFLWNLKSIHLWLRRVFVCSFFGFGFGFDFFLRQGFSL